MKKYVLINLLFCVSTFVLSNEHQQQENKLFQELSNHIYNQDLVKVENTTTSILKHFQTLKNKDNTDYKSLNIRVNNKFNEALSKEESKKQLLLAVKVGMRTCCGLFLVGSILSKKLMNFLLWGNIFCLSFAIPNDKIVNASNITACTKTLLTNIQQDEREFNKDTP